MDSIIKDQVVDHLVNNSLINKSQQGFMKHKLCVTNLLEFFDKITLETDNNIPMNIIYLDFSKHLIRCQNTNWSKSYNLIV